MKCFSPALSESIYTSGDTSSPHLGTPHYKQDSTPFEIQMYVDNMQQNTTTEHTELPWYVEM